MLVVLRMKNLVLILKVRIMLNWHLLLLPPLCLSHLHLRLLLLLKLLMRWWYWLRPTYKILPWTLAISLISQGTVLYLRKVLPALYIDWTYYWLSCHCIRSVTGIAQRLVAFCSLHLLLILWWAIIVILMVHCRVYQIELPLGVILRHHKWVVLDFGDTVHLNIMIMWG